MKTKRITKEIDVEVEVDIDIPDIFEALEVSTEDEKQEVLLMILNNSSRKYKSNSYDKMRDELIYKVLEKLKDKSIAELEEIINKT